MSTDDFESLLTAAGAVVGATVSLAAFVQVLWSLSIDCTGISAPRICAPLSLVVMILFYIVMFGGGAFGSSIGKIAARRWRGA